MKIDFHVHTSRSIDGVHSPRQMVKTAKTAGLDGIAITDHNRLFPRSEARRLSKEFGLIVIPGIEGGNIAVQKHWIALGICGHVTRFGRTVSSILSAVRSEGGISVAPHPNSRRGFRDFSRWGFDAVEVLNGCSSRAGKPVQNTSNIPEVAGSDAHSAQMLGYTWTEVDASGPPDDILEAVRRGRCRPEGTCIPAFPFLLFYPLYGWHRILRKPGEMCHFFRKAVREINRAGNDRPLHADADYHDIPGDQISPVPASR